MKKLTKPTQKLEKEDIRQAVIVDYRAIGCKSSEDGQNKKPFIQYSLEWLLIEKFQEVFICCLPDNAQSLREFVNNFMKIENVPSTMTIQVHSSEHNISTGDCLRDLDSKALIKTDFVIMDVGCCGNLPLAELLDAHKKLKKVDKTAIMTSIVRNVFTKDPEVIGEFSVYVIDPNTGHLLYYAAGRVSVDDPNEVVSKNVIEVPTEIFLKHSLVKIYNNLCSTNLSIYSANVPVLFADLFDCRTEASLIQAAFDHDDVLGCSVYVHVVDDLFSQHMADMGFVINQRRDQFDSGLIYRRSNRYDTIRQLVNKSLIGCTRLNTQNYLSNLKEDDEESDIASESDYSGCDEAEANTRANEQFYTEVLDSLIRGYEEEIGNNNLQVEVNCSKHAYNTSMEDMYSIIGRVLLMLPQKLSKKPQNSSEFFKCVETAIVKFKDFLLNYFKSDSSRDTLLNALEDVYFSNENEYLSDVVLAKIFYSLYQANILDEESVIKWNSQILDEDEDGEREKLRSKPGIARLVETLAADSDEDDDDDD